jgi:hypothetical protein
MHAWEVYRVRVRVTQTNWKNVWKIQAFRTWHQPNDYICGAISINRFAFELKPYKSRETVDSELLGLIETPDKLENENYCRAADLFEYLLKNKLDAIKILEDGLMTMDEEEEDFEQDDEATITKKKKLKKKLEKLKEGGTRRSQREKAMAATEQSISATTERLTLLMETPSRKRRKTTHISTDKCLAGELCRQQEEDMILEGERVNADRCHNCQNPCHYTCLHEKNWLMSVKSTVVCVTKPRW